MPPLVMRSKLFVPGTRADRYAKALATAADQVVLDLEDSVPAALKPEARDRVRAFLRSDAAAAAAERLMVRVNAAGAPGFADDLRALAGGAARRVNLPKVESPEDVHAALAAIDGARGDARVTLLCTIETPRGLRRAHEIGAASPRVAGLQLGLVDLLGRAGIDRADAAAVHATMVALALAAAEAGVPVYDSAYPPLDDEPGFRAEAMRARALGYAGKTCIHPRQVPWAHAAFAPRPDELAWARRVVEAAAAHGGAVFALDGSMVDAPIVERAQRLLRAGDVPADVPVTGAAR